MKQFLLGKEPDRDGIVRLKGDDYRYLVRVRRLAVGEFFPALLPGGKETLAQILSIERGALAAKCLPPQQASTEKFSEADKNPFPKLILLQALPKGDRMDLIVRQAAEGGVAEIVPFVSEFSIAKGNAGGQKFSRWERIIKEARQQSGSKTATVIRECLTMSGLFNYWDKLRQEGALGLLFHHISLSEKGLAKKSLHEYLNSIPEIAAFAIGPEGGFSDKEASLFMENGFKPLTIGDSVLRTETAALYCAAAIKIILLEKDSWELSKAKQNNASTC